MKQNFHFVGCALSVSKQKWGRGQKRIVGDKIAMTEKRCIFHVPNYVDPKGLSGSNVRPYQMAEAFRNNGYIVDMIMGYGRDRKAQIAEIKRKISNGVKYDFLYSESSTMPTLLTERHHLPVYPFLDFGFLKFCKRKGIKIGLFYRDIYWKFPLYREKMNPVKAYIATKMYQYDLCQYNRLLDVLFLPSIDMKRYISEITDSLPIHPLPPGTCPVNKITRRDDLDDTLRLIYVGGISRDVYDLTNLLKSVVSTPGTELTICCREKDWAAEKEYYECFLNERIKIVHTWGDGLKPYYSQADMSCLVTNQSDYRSFCMPIKLFEYLAFQKPVFITDGSAGAEFVRANGMGVVVRQDEESIKSALRDILSHRDKIREISHHMEEVSRNHSWSVRAQTVEAILCGSGSDEPSRRMMFPESGREHTGENL